MGGGVVQLAVSMKLMQYLYVVYLGAIGDDGKQILPQKWKMDRGWIFYSKFIVNTIVGKANMFVAGVKCWDETTGPRGSVTSKWKWD
jgi:hypothetical protein